MVSAFMAGWLIQAAVYPDSVAASPESETKAQPVERVKATVAQLGVGAQVMVLLKGGESIKGRIESIETEGFLLASKRETSPGRISYDRVNRINLAKLSYHAAGKPDAAEARRDRKSTRLNSSHRTISYTFFCLKK